MSRRLLGIAEINDPLTGAIADLLPGKNGIDQPAAVKKHILALERTGLAVHDGKGWRRTAIGEERAASLLRTAKRWKRTGRIGE